VASYDRSPFQFLSLHFKTQRVRERERKKDRERKRETELHYGVERENKKPHHQRERERGRKESVNFSLKERERKKMVTEEQISEAVSSLLRESNPSQRSFTTLNQVVEELQAKLGHDLSHKLDFITAQINLLFGSQPQPPQPPPQNAHRQIQQPKDHFAPPPNPNFHSVPVSSGFQAPKFPNSNAVVATAADISRAEAPAPVPAPAPVNDAPKERLGFAERKLFSLFENVWKSEN